MVSEEMKLKQMPISAKLIDDLMNINSKEPEACQALTMVIHHIAGTYSDKYEVTEQTVIDTKKMLYHPDMGLFINVYQVSRYLQRLLTKGKQKSNLTNDVFKAIHYLLFEITRRIRCGEIDNKEVIV